MLATAALFLPREVIFYEYKEKYIMTTYAQNRKAAFNYNILKKYEAGIELHGFEVKAIRNSLASLQGAFVVINEGEAFLTNAQIAPYQKANTPADYKEDRERRLLLRKKELEELEEQSKIKGLTLVPIRLYNKHGLIKLELALAKGKKKYDKRDTIKKRDVEREIKRKLK
ncbi:MAG: SsrA-binding protein SmpB [Candidatus Spechtbacterales bacterium]